MNKNMMRNMYRQMDAPDSTVQKLYQQIDQESKVGIKHSAAGRRKKIVLRTVGVTCACACLCAGVIYTLPRQVFTSIKPFESSMPTQEVQLNPAEMDVQSLSEPYSMTFADCCWRCTGVLSEDVARSVESIGIGEVAPYQGAESPIVTDVYAIDMYFGEMQNGLPYAVAVQPDPEGAWYAFVQEDPVIQTLSDLPLLQSESFAVGTVTVQQNNCVTAYTLADEDALFAVMQLLESDCNRMNLYQGFLQDFPESSFQPVTSGINWDITVSVQISEIGAEGYLALDLETGLLRETVTGNTGNLFRLEPSVVETFLETVTTQAETSESPEEATLPKIEHFAEPSETIEEVYDRIASSASNYKQLSGALSWNNCRFTESDFVCTAWANVEFQYDNAARRAHQIAVTGYEGDAPIRFEPSSETMVEQDTVTIVCYIETTDPYLRTETCSGSDFAACSNPYLLGACFTYLNIFLYPETDDCYLIGTVIYQSRPCYVLIVMNKDETAPRMSQRRILIDQETGIVMKNENCGVLEPSSYTEDPVTGEVIEGEEYDLNANYYIESIVLTEIKWNEQADPVESIPEELLQKATENTGRRSQKDQAIQREKEKWMREQDSVEQEVGEE